jgi:cell shape-determining protein MreD
MRTATIVIVTYAFGIVLAAIWHRFPIGFVAQSAPNIGALTAAYLGLTARRGLAPAMAGAVITGYLLDLVGGTPAGYMALVLALTCVIAYGTQRRILVRGTAMTIAFSGFIALVAGMLGWAVRVSQGMSRATTSLELQFVVVATGTTMLLGPMIWRGFRRIDAGFARTQRERDAALEGLAP